MALAQVMQLHYPFCMDNDDLESSLTDRYQTTVPARIRKALGLTKRDKLQWLLDDSGGVRLSRKSREEPEHVDPVLEAWLGFIERDILEHPERLVPLDEAWYQATSAGLSGMPATLAEFIAMPLIDDNEPLGEDDF